MILCRLRVARCSRTARAFSALFFACWRWDRRVFRASDSRPQSRFLAGFDAASSLDAAAGEEFLAVPLASVFCGSSFAQALQAFSVFQRSVFTHASPIGLAGNLPSHAAVIGARDAVDQVRIAARGSGSVGLHARAAVRLGPDVGGHVDGIARPAQYPRRAVLGVIRTPWSSKAPTTANQERSKLDETAVMDGH